MWDLMWDPYINYRIRYHVRHCQTDIVSYLGYL